MEGLYNFYYDQDFGWSNEYWMVDGKIQKGVAIHDINNDGYDDVIYGTDDNTLEIWIKVNLSQSFLMMVVKLEAHQLLLNLLKMSI